MPGTVSFSPLTWTSLSQPGFAFSFMADLQNLTLKLWSSSQYQCSLGFLHE